MKRLIILAHPSKSGFNYSIANKIKEISEKNNIQVDFLDLYENPQNFLSYENQKNPDFDPQRENIQNRIKLADELVFVYPIWWDWTPAILKNFFDQNFSTWFAYKYVDWKPLGLLKWKTARIFCSLWWSNELVHHRKTMESILWFCWIQIDTFKIFNNVRTEIDTNEHFKELERLL